MILEEKKKKSKRNKYLQKKIEEQYVYRTQDMICVRVLVNCLTQLLILHKFICKTNLKII